MLLFLFVVVLCVFGVVGVKVVVRCGWRLSLGAIVVCFFVVVCGR